MLPMNIAGERLPEYHEGMLIVKVRPTAQPVAAMAAGVAMVDSPVESPAMSALAWYERAGLIKRVIPLARPSVNEAPPMGMMGVMAMFTVEPDPHDEDSDVHIVELQRDEEVSNLQIALARDPRIEAVARVPVRYIAMGEATQAGQKGSKAERPRGSRREGGATPAAIPPDSSSLWNLHKIGWRPTFKQPRDIRVAVLDTGIDPDHPDLADGNGRPRVGQERYIFAHPELPRASSNRDYVGHGTHVAGTIAANFRNHFGVKGICECELHAWKIFDDIPDFDSKNNRFVYFVNPVMYRRALADCLDLGIDVINLSIGGTGRPDFQEQSLFSQLLAQGTIVVAAMGNARLQGSPTMYPAAIPGVIAVGATKIDDTIANFSNRGNHISLCAPGAGIWSTLPTYPGQSGFQAILGPHGRPVSGQPIRRDTDYAAWNGTSMAAPHVTAAAALLLAQRGRMSGADVREQLKQTADRVPNMHGADFDSDYGAGRLNLEKLLQ